MHLPANCPCYCTHCGVTAAMEVISSEHKEKCHKFPLSCPNNCGQENIVRDNMDEHRKVCPLEMIECEFSCGARIARNELDKHNQENMNKHVQLLCEKAIKKYKHVITVIVVIIAAIFIQSHYFATDRSDQDYFAKVFDRINDGDIIEIDKKIIMAMNSRQFGNHKELDDQLRQARLHINELENNISAVKAQIDEELTKSRSDKEQLQNNIENLRIREMKLFEELMRSRSLINVLRASYNALMVRHSGKLIQPITADCECDILTARIGHLLSSLESVYISYNSYKPLWPLILDLSNRIPEQVALAAILKMSNFAKMKKSKERWYSKPFFAYRGGYKMGLQVDAAGSDKGEGTHVSVYLFLMKGPHDDKLQQSGKWPLRGTFIIEWRLCINC